MNISIFGIDFTSAPSRRKPITCVRCSFTRGTLTVLDCPVLPDFSAFEAFLLQPGPWVAACDFPFGQPRRLIEDLQWPQTWHGYISHIAGLGKDGFATALTDYMANRPPGQKLLLRLTDQIAGARSPMMLYRVPVGKMFFEGVPRLLASGVSVLPCLPREDRRIVVEGYPALVARRWLGKRAYKSDERKKQTAELTAARRDLISGILSSELAAAYDLKLSLSSELVAQLIEEPMADRLDAILCAIQAAWAYQLREHPKIPYGIPLKDNWERRLIAATESAWGATQLHGIPPNFASEGWIIDPAVVDAYLSNYL